MTNAAIEALKAELEKADTDLATTLDETEQQIREGRAAQGLVDSARRRRDELTAAIVALERLEEPQVASA